MRFVPAFFPSTNYPDDGNGKAGSHSIVGLNGYSVGVAAARGFQIFHPNNAAAVLAGIALFDQFGANGIVPLGLYSEDSERIVLVRQDFDLHRQRRSGLALQAYLGRTELDEFFNFSGDDQRKRGLRRIVGLHTDRFPFLPSPVVTGIESDGDASFLPGKDLPRTGRGRAASAGFDFEDVERLISPVKNDEVVDDRYALRHRREFEYSFGKFHLGACWRFGRCGLTKIWRQAKKGQ